MHWEHLFVLLELVCFVSTGTSHMQTTNITRLVRRYLKYNMHTTQYGLQSALNMRMNCDIP